MAVSGLFTLITSRKLHIAIGKQHVKKGKWLVSEKTQLAAAGMNMEVGYFGQNALEVSIFLLLRGQKNVKCFFLTLFVVGIPARVKSSETNHSRDI